MRKISMFIVALCAGWACQSLAQQTVTIKGNVKFVDKDFKVSVYQRNGTDKKVLAEVPVNEDHTYSVTVPFDKPGVAIVDCGHWQDVNVWLETRTWTLTSEVWTPQESKSRIHLMYIYVQERRMR